MRTERHDFLGASTYVEKGWSLISQGAYRDAESALATALSLAPGDARAEALLGWALMRQGRLEEALQSQQQLAARDPSHALARANLGYIWLRKGHVTEAVEHLTAALRLDNDRLATLYANYYLGLLYLEREMYDDARPFLERAVALGPSMGEAYYDLGRSHWLAGRIEPARAAWRAGAERAAHSAWGKRCTGLLQQVESHDEKCRLR